MTIWPDDATLEMQNIDSLEDVPIDLHGAPLMSMELRTALRLILNKTTDPPLTYVIQNQVIMITTVDQANSETNLMTRVYPVGHLLHGNLPEAASEFDDLAPVSETLSAEVTPDKLAQLIQQMTAPPARWTELHGEGGSISMFRNHLLIRQSASGHRAVVRLLRLLSRTVELSEPAE